MALKISNTVKDAMLDAFEASIGTSAILRIRSGAVPATINDGDVGLPLAVLNLPSDWMAAASGGSKAKLGTWEDLGADNAGTATYFRLYKSDGITQQMQGTVGTIGTDLILDDITIEVGQAVVITMFTLIAGN
jgi:hypothetical protein